MSMVLLLLASPLVGAASSASPLQNEAAFRLFADHLMNGAIDMHVYDTVTAASTEACKSICRADKRCIAAEYGSEGDEKVADSHCMLSGYEQAATERLLGAARAAQYGAAQQARTEYKPPTRQYTESKEYHKPIIQNTYDHKETEEYAKPTYGGKVYEAPAAEEYQEEKAYEAPAEVKEEYHAPAAAGYAAPRGYGRSATYQAHGMSSFTRFMFGMLLLFGLWLLITGFVGCLRCCQWNQWACNVCFFFCPCICTEMCSDWANQWCTLPCPCQNDRKCTCAGWNCSTNRWFCQRTPMRFNIHSLLSDPGLDAAINAGLVDPNQIDQVRALRITVQSKKSTPAQRTAAALSLAKVTKEILNQGMMSSCDRCMECISPCRPVDPWTCRMKCVTLCSALFIWFGWIFYDIALEGLTAEPPHHRPNTGFLLPDGDDASLWFAATLASLPYLFEDKRTGDQFPTTTNHVGGGGWFKDCYHTMEDPTYGDGPTYEHDCAYTNAHVSYKMNLVMTSLTPEWHDFALEKVLHDPENGNLAMYGTVRKQGRSVRWMSYRGTSNVDNMKTDFHGSRKGVTMMRHPDYLGGAAVSKEFYGSYGQLMGRGDAETDFKKLGPKAHETFHRWYRDDPSADVLIVGHSLGGVFATYGAVDATHLGLPVTMLTFNSPRPGGRDLSDWVKRHIPNSVRLTCSKDVISMGPPRATGFWHVGRSVVVKVSIGKKGGLLTVDPKELIYHTWADDNPHFGPASFLFHGTSVAEALVAHSFWVLGAEASLLEIKASRQGKNGNMEALNAMGAFQVPKKDAVPFLNLVDFFPDNNPIGYAAPGGSLVEYEEEELEDYRRLTKNSHTARALRSLQRGVTQLRGAFGRREE